MNIFWQILVVAVFSIFVGCGEREQEITDLSELDTGMNDTLESALKAFRGRDFEAALKLANELIDITPKEPYPYRFKGEVLFEMGRFAECLAPFRDAEAIGGEASEECFFWRALAYLNMGEPNLAVVILQEYKERPDARPDMKAKCDQLLHQLGRP